MKYRKAIRGSRFAFQPADYLKLPAQAIANGKATCKRVRCINTGQEYQSLTDAAKAAKDSTVRLSAHILKDKPELIGGMRYEYISQ